MASRKAPAKVRGVYERDPGSGIWWICYKQGTVRKREKVGSRGNAKALYQQRKTELRAGAKLAPNLRHKGVSFAELAVEALAWSAEHHPKDIRTVRGRMKTVLEEFGAMAARDIEAQAIDRWLTAHTKWAPATKNRYRALISLVYRQAMRAGGKVASNPARSVAARVENNGRMRSLSENEERALRKAMHGRYDLHIPSLDIALNTGMRLTEQFSLKWDQVDLESEVPAIKLDETKNGSSREIPINPACAAAFNELAKVPHGKGDRVFQSSRGEPLNRPRAWFTKVVDEANLGDFRWHDLRHTFCSRLARAEVDVLTIAQLAGHKSLATTKRYVHLDSSHTFAAVKKLGG
jgi:integrase